MIAYHGKPEVKQKYLDRVKAHRLADELIRGTGWENGKGCAVGCTLDAYDHARYPVELGIPEMLARLEDAIFEGMVNGKSMLWPERFLSAIKPGADLSRVGPKFLLAINKRNCARLNKKQLKVVGPAIDGVIVFLEKWAETGTVDEKLASAARSAARSAAESAESAAESAARSAARSAASAAWSAARSAESAARSAESAARSAESAAWSAARSAESAAWSAEYKWMADTLIKLLKAAA